MGTFEEFRDETLATTRSVGEKFDEPDDDWEPVAILQGDKNIIALLKVDKSQYAPLLKDMVRKFGGRYLAIVLSSWMVSYKGLSAAQRAIVSQIPPSQHPDRTEVLIVEIASPVDHEVWEAEITRRDGLPPLLGEWKKDDVTSMGGDLASICVAAFQPAGKA